MTSTFHPFFMQATTSQLSSQNNLPKGTAESNSHQILQLHKNILNEPNTETYIFPFPSNYATWIIVKEILPSQQPVFHLYYDALRKRVLSAQKQSNNIGCNFIISKQQRPKKDEHFVAKLRGNFRNNQFFVYDNGQNPKKKSIKKRKQLAYLRVDDDSIFGQSEEAKIQIIVPAVDLDTEGNHLKSRPKQITPNEQTENLLLEAYQNHSPSVINLYEKQGDQSFTSQQVLASYFISLQEKSRRINMKLEMNNPQSNSPVLILCSRTKNTYSMSFGYPLNMMQSFGIALAFIQRTQS